MNLSLLGRVSRIAAIGAILLSSASCITVNEELGESFIPTDQKWDVFPQEPVDLQDIRLQMADSLSGYNTSRFTFGAVNSKAFGTSIKSTCFTLVPVWDTLDFGEDMKIKQFHFTAVRDTLSMVNDNELKMLQNVYVSELKKPLDSTILYMNSLSDPAVLREYVDIDNRITIGTPVYAGGDSLSFDFSIDFAERFVEKLQKADLDSVALYTEDLPGIYITTDTPAGEGGRINMFNINLLTSSGYVTGNFAELKFSARYDGDTEPRDTSFLFLFGPGDFIEVDEDGNITYPTQFAFNTSTHETDGEYGKGGKTAQERIYVEGGSGIKPVIKAEEIKTILEELIAREGISDPSEVVVNKATIILPYDVDGDYTLLEKYPTILSPTVRIRSTDGNYVTYAGLTDSSVESENQGEIDRSNFMYSPDISHHVQGILELDRNDEDYAKIIENYDIWFLIMHEEVTETSSSSSNYSNYAYNSYYNMMYDPYGYGYGYGGYGYSGYGYGGYSGYNSYYNYYNYAMMAQMMYGSSSSTNTETSTELDKDRFYNAVLNGPQANGAKPQLKVTFSAPKSAE